MKYGNIAPERPSRTKSHPTIAVDSGGRAEKAFVKIPFVRSGMAIGLVCFISSIKTAHSPALICAVGQNGRISNMTNAALKKYPLICLKIAEQKNKLQDLKESAVSCSVSQSGMPHGSGVSDKVGRLGAEIAAIENEIVYLENRKAVIEGYIRKIPHLKLRKVFALHYLKGRKWKDAGLSCGYTESAAKKACYRWIKTRK